MEDMLTRIVVTTLVLGGAGVVAYAIGIMMQDAYDEKHYPKPEDKPEPDMGVYIIEDRHEHVPHWQIVQDQLIKQARTGTEQEKTAARTELRRLNPYLNV